MSIDVNNGASFIDTVGISSFLEFISNPPYFKTNSLNFLSYESSLFNDILGDGKISLLVPPTKLEFKALAISLLNISSLAPEIIILASVFNERLSLKLTFLFCVFPPNLFVKRESSIIHSLIFIDIYTFYIDFFLFINIVIITVFIKIN